MRTTRTTHPIIALAAALALTPACSIDVPDLNNPGLDQLADNPTPVTIGAACTGLLIGDRSNIAAENGYVSIVGILGREAYNFDGADPRYVGELLQGQLSAASPFGGNFWAFPYSNIKLAYIILHAIDKLPAAQLSDADKSAIRGFSKTMIAIGLLQVIVTHDTNGAVIAVDRDPTAPLAPIVDAPTTYKEIESKLDDAVTDLTAAGDSFPFGLSSGFIGLDTPATFIKFNRAIRARVAAYVQDYPGVLTALQGSFLADTAPIDFTTGAYYVYSTKTGDLTNQLINPNIYAHPTLATDAKHGALVDARFTRKVATAAKAGSAQGLTSPIAFGPLYGSPESPVGLIRNEELVLLKAEALFFTSNASAAYAELNLVRTQSGGLPALTPSADETTFVDDLLYERRYSLMFEGGHRWIDQRRFNRPLLLDQPADVRNIRFPIPLTECNARPGEPRCQLGST